MHAIIIFYIKNDEPCLFIAEIWNIELTINASDDQVFSDVCWHLYFLGRKSDVMTLDRRLKNPPVEGCENDFSE